jgi:hypothetical protein
MRTVFSMTVFGSVFFFFRTMGRPQFKHFPAETGLSDMQRGQVRVFSGTFQCHLGS